MPVLDASAPPSLDEASIAGVGGGNCDAMKVLHVTEVLAGGVATYLNEVLPWQARQLAPGALTLICPASEVKYLSEAVRRVVKLQLFERRQRDLGSLWRLWRAVRRARRTVEPQILHAHSSFAGLLVRLGIGRRRHATIYTPHGWSMAMEVSWLRRWLYALAERMLSRRCEVIVAVSQHELDVAHFWKIPGAKLRLVVSGLRPALTDRRGKPRDGPIELLFVGRWDRQKGLDWLLDVMRQLTEVRIRLRVAGAATMPRTEVWSWPDNVEPLGWINTMQLDHYYDAADAVIIPSRWEALGLVALEAMRRGIAVLASDRGALPEVVEDGITGHIFSLEQPGALQRWLQTISRQQLRQMGERGRARFFQHFGGQRMNQELFELYRSAAHRDGQKGHV
jgi:glycosyltransferase involved in cell wall biosynthesis